MRYSQMFLVPLLVALIAGPAAYLVRNHQSGSRAQERLRDALYDFDTNTNSFLKKATGGDVPGDVTPVQLEQSGQEVIPGGPGTNLTFNPDMDLVLHNGDQVITDDESFKKLGWKGGVLAKVQGIYPNGQVSLVLSDGYLRSWQTKLYTLDSRTLARTKKGCVIVDEKKEYKFCIGDNVITADNSTNSAWKGGIPGKVVGIYPDGQVSFVERDGIRDHYTVDPRTLARTEGCVVGTQICVGNKIITEDGLRAKVVGIYSNGRVSLILDGGHSDHYSRDASTLARR